MVKLCSQCWHVWSPAVVAASLAVLVAGRSQTAPKPCSQKENDYYDMAGWRFLESCTSDEDEEGVSRNVHFSRYTHEALALPALAAMGEKAQRILVLGGSDGGVVSQVLKSSDVKEVICVTGSKLHLEAKEGAPYAYYALRSDRWKIIDADPLTWLESDGPSASSFDIVIVHFEFEYSVSHDGEVRTPSLQASVFQGLAAMIAPGGLLIYDAAALWQMQFLQDTYKKLRSVFPRVWTLQHAAPDNFPSSPAIAFVAGDKESDVTKQDASWWKEQDIRSIFYSADAHHALLSPSAMLSRSLGLQMPSHPDLQMAYSPNESLSSTLQPALSSPCLNESIKQTLIHKEKTKYQKLKVMTRGDCVMLYLDGELQLTSEFGDFYHEATVHPVMAALGQRGKRVLIIGAGDGGVASVVLQYPGVQEVVQVEIDDRVVANAKKYLPHHARGYSDERHTLIIGNAAKWVGGEQALKKYKGLFDFCIIDTTDDPLNSPFNEDFFKNLRALLAPHGAVAESINSQGFWLEDFREIHADVFDKLHILSCYTPDFPSPYLLTVLTASGADALDLNSVDWNWWSSLNIPTIYYQPTLHSALLSAPAESQGNYVKGKEWVVHDARHVKRFYRAKERQKKKKNVSRSKAKKQKNQEL
eukprot:TRINITY_DN8679_c0_g2_i2.p1 TRINITY_DN8679_c0_g2~~TRINITY_DN8679_c0_g2_i2.p1  ORF type:complete len:642 (-),score=107.79 TRINITY_DN8679_c0_g2_i2:676-2601(-)